MMKPPLLPLPFIALFVSGDGTMELSPDLECPRKLEMTLERKCLKKCRTDLDCRGRNKQCLCDDVCGKSCVKPSKSSFLLLLLFIFHYTFEKRYYVFHPITRFVCLSVCLSVSVCVCVCVCVSVCLSVSHHVCGEMAGLSNMVSSGTNTRYLQELENATLVKIIRF